MYNNIIAHKDIYTGAKQTLEEHLISSAKLAKELGDKIELGNVLYLIAILHDIGKASKAFQDKIKYNTNAFVDHSTAGAYYLQKLFAKALSEDNELAKKGLITYHYLNLLEISQYVIEAHHGVFDTVKQSDDNSCNVSHVKDRLRFFADSNNTKVDEYFKFLNAKYELDKVAKKAIVEFRNSVSKLKIAYMEEDNFYRLMYIRLFLSILKTADIYDTINSCEEIVDLDRITLDRRLAYQNKIEEKAKSFGTPTREINKIRQLISEQSRESGLNFSTGIYRLDVPTGGGKTISAMRFATNHMVEHGKDRIFYLTAFLSVLEQNASEIKNIFGEENKKYILEHHSNIIEDDEKLPENERIYREYLIQTWDDDIVLSTVVQFFNTLMKSKADNLRRFASLINSIVVIDEVQSLPTKVIYIFNMAMNFMKTIMNTTVVLCTATQPPYNHKDIKYPMRYGNIDMTDLDIVTLSDKQRSIFDRTVVAKLKEDLNQVSLNDIVDEIANHENDSTLVILNTKKVVKKLYDKLGGANNPMLYYLTTNLCPEHRRNIIKEIKAKLNNNEPVICVSTQLIEAGVDVDFDRVIRSYAGIDSIVQAAGRCNREGKKEKGYVTLVNLNNFTENTKPLPDIYERKKIAIDILFAMNGIIDLNDLSNEYFRKYYANHNLEMYYLLKPNEPTLFAKMVTGEKRKFDIKGYIDNIEDVDIKNFMLNQQLKEISNDFELINSDTIGVIVKYGGNDELVEELIDNINAYEDSHDFIYLKAIRKLLRKLQPYTVNMYKKADSKIFIEYLSDSNMPIHILADGYYDDNFGVIEDSEKALLVI